MKNNKWSVESFNDKPIHVVLFCSRNKDNKHLDNFKERRKSFITHKKPEELETEFNSFVSQGVEGEMCRMYYSVNSRDPQKVYNKLMHFLFDNPDFNLCSLEPKIAGLAAQKECAETKNWMFDFDLDDEEKVEEFIGDIYKISEEAYRNIINEPLFLSKNAKLHSHQYVRKYKTPHGFAVVSYSPFDTRSLMEKWKENVTLKRDDLLCLNWKIKD